jgi:hypothetical protein
VDRAAAGAAGGRLLAVEHAAHDRQRLGEPAQPLGVPAAEVEAEVARLLLEPGAPIPRIARPLLMWSSVVAILATRLGSRYGLAPTIRPMRTRSVLAARAVMVSQPS